MAAPPRISVVLLVYAEKHTITAIAARLGELLGESLHEVTLLVAAAAPAETLEICRAAAARLPRTRLSMQRENPGAGLAVRQGIAEASGTHILLMDSDGEMDVETVPRMVAALAQHGADMVVASRWAAGGGAVGYDPVKYVLNRGYQLLFRVLFRTRIHDLTLGFKLARADVMKSLPWTSRFHGIGCETTLRVLRAGFSVVEVPTVWRKRAEGASSNRFWRNLGYVAMALAILCGPSHRAEAASRSTV